jgi:ABC-type microcin C transport system permease subunit YejE
MLKRTIVDLHELMIVIFRASFPEPVIAILFVLFYVSGGSLSRTLLVQLRLLQFGGDRHRLSGGTLIETNYHEKATWQKDWIWSSVEQFHL